MNIAPITRFANRNALRIKKHSPQILFYGGIVGTVATTVLASRATLKAVPVLDELRSQRAELDNFANSGDISKEDYSRAAKQQYTYAGVALTKLYGPVVIIGIGSLACLTKSHQQLTSRNAGLTAAYAGLFKTFENYRDRVRADLGSDVDQKFLHGTVKQEIEVTGKNGQTKTKEITALDPSSAAALTYWFDRKTSSWNAAPGYNQNMLDGQQDWCNILLAKRGHLFLNDVYDLLGIERTREGNILGWVHEDLGNNDTFVRFGHQNDGEFIGGFKKDVMLEFNIHGPILDLI